MNIDINENYVLKRAYLGGTGEMYELVCDGHNYLYKPAVRKGTSISEPFRGIVQECGYEVQKIVDPDSAVLCKYITDYGLAGAVQERIKVNPNGRNYTSFQISDSEILSKEEVDQFMREFVTDYLICNFDPWGGNFVTDKNGVIRGVDKEQSFRYINNPESEKPSIDYAPNSRYGTPEPIYNTIFRRYSEGSLDIDFNVIDKYMKRVEAVNDSDYRSIFKPYCAACGIAFGVDENQLLDKIVSRKINMRSNIEEFFNKLTDVREKGVGSSGKH